MKPKYKTLPAGYTPPSRHPAPPQAVASAGGVVEGAGSLLVLGLAALGGYVLYQNYVKKR